jgi:hypothetical protein
MVGSCTRTKPVKIGRRRFVLILLVQNTVQVQNDENVYMFSAPYKENVMFGNATTGVITSVII